MAYEPTSAWPPWKKRIAETIEEGYKQGDPMTDTTTTLLKQACEALWDVAQELHHIDSGPTKELGDVIAKVEDAASALTTSNETIARLTAEIEAMKARGA